MMQRQPGGMAVNSFNGVMYEFLKQLVELLPEEGGVKTAFDAFQIMANDPSGDERKKPAVLFMTKAAQYQDLIQGRNDKFITQVAKTIPFFQGMNIDKHWKNFDNDQKDAMWEFLNMMLMLGTTVLSVPAHMQQAVENLATSMMQNPQQMQSIMSTISNPPQ
jgi:hypothetical protein